MMLYDLMRQYARENRLPMASESVTPELGTSLSLFHGGLVESGLAHEGPPEKPRLTASPDSIDSSHLSHFIVAYLPFNSVTGKEETNAVLFDVYSFFRWLEKRNIAHGLTGINLTEAFKDLLSSQDRCLRLSHLMDEESGRVLEDTPEIVQTVNDVFRVENIEGNRIFLKGQRQEEVISLRVPPQIPPLMNLKDTLELVLGDTSERWVVLEAGQVYPSYPFSSPSPKSS